VLGGKFKTYIPDFRKAFEHFCIHAGGACHHRRAAAQPQPVR
jgi:hypothetical protein